MIKSMYEVFKTMFLYIYFRSRGQPSICSARHLRTEAHCTFTLPLNIAAILTVQIALCIALSFPLCLSPSLYLSSPSLLALPLSLYVPCPRSFFSTSPFDAPVPCRRAALLLLLSGSPPFTSSLFSAPMPCRCMAHFFCSFSPLPSRSPTHDSVSLFCCCSWRVHAAPLRRCPRGDSAGTRRVSYILNNTCDARLLSTR